MEGSGYTQLSVIQRLAYGIWFVARKLGIMHWPPVRYVAEKVYECVRPKGKIQIEAHGNTYALKASDRGMTPMLLKQKDYEAEEIQLVKRMIKPGMTVVDIGANIGYFTVIFSKLVGENGRVFAFEPEPENLTYLNENIAANQCKNVEVAPIALADKKGQVDFFVPERTRSTSSMVASNLIYEKGAKRISVGTESLDEFLSGKQVSQVDFIKIDVQGAESIVFSGAKQVLSQDHLGLMMEFWPFGMEKAGADVREYLQMFERYGFSFYEPRNTERLLEPVQIDDLLNGRTYEKRDYINLFLQK